VRRLFLLNQPPLIGWRLNSVLVCRNDVGLFVHLLIALLGWRFRSVRVLSVSLAVRALSVAIEIGKLAIFHRWTLVFAEFVRWFKSALSRRQLAIELVHVAFLYATQARG